MTTLEGLSRGLGRSQCKGGALRLSCASSQPLPRRERARVQQHGLCAKDISKSTWLSNHLGISMA